MQSEKLEFFKRLMILLKLEIRKNFVDELLNQHWEYIYFFGDDPNAIWEIWRELFLEVLNKHAPIQHKKTKSSKVPWITNKIKSHKYERQIKKKSSYHQVRN